MTRLFVEACASGDMRGLLSEDEVFYSDGRGKVVTACNPVYEPDRVARSLLGLARKRPPGFASRLVGINGRLGVIAFPGGLPDSVLTLEIADGQIRVLRNVRNPDKLRTVPRLSEIDGREDR